MTKLFFSSLVQAGKKQQFCRAHTTQQKFFLFKTLMKDKSQLPICETSEQSTLSMEQLFTQTRDQSLTSKIRDLLFLAYNYYETSFKNGDIKQQMYWDGYIRALHHVNEAQGH